MSHTKFGLLEWVSGKTKFTPLNRSGRSPSRIEAIWESYAKDGVVQLPEVGETGYIDYVRPAHVDPGVTAAIDPDGRKALILRGNLDSRGRDGVIVLHQRYTGNQDLWVVAGHYNALGANPLEGELENNMIKLITEGECRVGKLLLEV